MEERRNEDIITTFLVIAKNWKHPQCQPTGVCLNEYAYIHTSEYCSAGLYGLGGRRRGRGMGIILFWAKLLYLQILVPPSGIEPEPSAVKAQSSTHWTAREFPLYNR